MLVIDRLKEPTSSSLGTYGTCTCTSRVVYRLLAVGAPIPVPPVQVYMYLPKVGWTLLERDVTATYLPGTRYVQVGAPTVICYRMHRKKFSNTLYLVPRYR